MTINRKPSYFPAGVPSYLPTGGIRGGGAPSAGVSALLQDTFTGADSTVISSRAMDSGQTWVKSTDPNYASSNITITSNQATADVTNTSSYNVDISSDTGFIVRVDSSELSGTGSEQINVAVGADANDFLDGSINFMLRKTDVRIRQHAPTSAILTVSTDESVLYWLIADNGDCSIYDSSKSQLGTTVTPTNTNNGTYFVFNMTFGANTPKCDAVAVYQTTDLSQVP